MNTNKENINSFLVQEYEKIADAHFNTSGQISSFFKYYLTLMSVPSIVLLYVDKDSSILKELINSQKHDGVKVQVGWLCMLISIIGLCISIYLIKLKFEHILYARVVNGIRKCVVDMDCKLKDYLLLPTDTKIPSYFGLGFGSLVFVIAVVNSVYLYISLHLLNTSFAGIIGICFGAINFILYFILAYFEEKKSNEKT